MPIEKRHALHERFPDAEHPVVRTHPETGEKVLFVNAFTTHFTNFHTAGERPLRASTTRPAASELLNYLIRQAAVPEYQVRWRWTHEQLRDLGQPLHPALRRPGLLARRPQDGARRDRRRHDLLTTTSTPTNRTENPMHFLDDSLFPENQEKLVITAAPVRPGVGAGRLPRGPPADDGRARPAGGRLLERRRHRAAHPRARAGRQGLQAAVEVQRAARPAARGRAGHDPAGRRLDLLRPGGRGRATPSGSSDDTRHMLAELDPKPDQVTIAINTNQMNIVELMTDDDIAGTSFERPELYEAYREMDVPAGPEWVEEHLQAADRQRHPAALPAGPHPRSWRPWSGWSAAASTPAR